MDWGISILGLFAILFVLVLIGGVGVLLILLVLKSQRRRRDPAVDYQEEAPCPNEKKEILEMLANKEISKEEADQRLQGK